MMNLAKTTRTEKQEQMDMATLKRCLGRQTGIKYLSTELMKFSDIYDKYLKGEYIAPSQQRDEGCMNQTKTNQFVSTILDGASHSFPAIEIGILNDKMYFVDGLQRFSTWFKIYTGEWYICYIEGIDSKPLKTKLHYSQFPVEAQELFDNAEIKVNFTEYPSMEAMVEVMHRMNTTATTMTYGEVALMNTDSRIVDFIELEDKKAEYKLNTVFNFNKDYKGRSDRGALKVLAIECFLMAAYSDELVSFNGSSKDFLAAKASNISKEKFEVGRKLYREVMRAMSVIAINNCNFKITRYRALWFALCRAYEDNMLTTIMNNQTQVVSLMKSGEIWFDSPMAGKGATCCYNKLRDVYRFLNEEVFSKVGENWIETVEIEVNKEDLLPTTEVTTEESAS